LWAAAVLSLAIAVTGALPAWGALDDLARAGDWARVLEVASRRGEQLPLNAGEAMIAAHAARVLGDRPAEIRFLRLAAMGDNDRLAALAAVQLAAVVEPDDPASAVDLALPNFAPSAPWPLRESATQTVALAVERGLAEELRSTVEGSSAGLSEGLRRRLELALAMTDDVRQRQRLEKLLAASTADLVALQAAQTLAALGPMTSLEQWRVGLTFYRHALFDRAAPLLEKIVGVRHSSIPSDDVLFTLGRCAFRQARWSDAITWYQKALASSTTAERRAEIEVHIGRTYELSGDLDTAVTAAVTAVRLKTTDDRRLFLARLRLRRGETELAAKGISQLRGRTARAQGDVMLALDALRRGDRSGAFNRLCQVRSRPWSAPAAVLAAQLADKTGDRGTVIDLLEGAAPALDSYWGEQARRVMSTLPAEEIVEWRARRLRAVETAQGRSRWRAVGLWATLEPDPRQLEGIRQEVGGSLEVGESFSEAWFRQGLAVELWNIGLETEAGRWDPTGFPNTNAVRSAWTAARFVEFGMPWSAIRMADGAWRQAGSEVPMRGFSLDFQKTAYPLPYRTGVLAAAKAGGVDWSLLAAVAREESRWNPRALSVVGARGLVQLMPATARTVALRLGQSPPNPEGLFDPQTSLLLGAAELGRLVSEFGGRRAPAIAAYNAGEHQANLWLSQCGAGCSDDLYIATISFAATRSYTSTVLAGASMYSSLYAPQHVASSVSD
jgi:soluble lytic murein transglycosylase-like protein/tetratricopeptide (TPR) repeat protein